MSGLNTRVEEKKARASLISAVERLVSKEDVIYCGTPIEIAREWNSNRGEEGYEATIFDELVSRFEEPDDPKPPNLSTVAKPISETNYLYELEKTTQDIINAVLNVQKNDVGANSVTIPNTTKTIKLPSRTITLSELRRLRRQLTNINKTHTLDVDRVAELFVEYLNTNINR
ncbi:chromatin associated protein KTI12-domain-containing protein [Gigaspora rosea]|uniref:Chromatin associated protein KTI12-domain-containing protein n=1 Tax=Gigaspora rosea TaxID=44941 RepID=A0A397UW21_9GLOM|nr:chromatin associated protein KTI12-domain-containing protein [Gigaspora rosea]